MVKKRPGTIIFLAFFKILKLVKDNIASFEKWSSKIQGYPISWVDAKAPVGCCTRPNEFFVELLVIPRSDNTERFHQMVFTEGLLHAERSEATVR